MANKRPHTFKVERPSADTRRLMDQRGKIDDRKTPKKKTESDSAKNDTVKGAIRDAEMRRGVPPNKRLKD